VGGPRAEVDQAAGKRDRVGASWPGSGGATCLAAGAAQTSARQAEDASSATKLLAAGASVFSNLAGEALAKRDALLHPDPVCQPRWCLVPHAPADFAEVADLVSRVSGVLALAALVAAQYPDQRVSGPAQALYEPLGAISFATGAIATAAQC
jgi:predicted dienelactone hydrolase